MKLLKLTFVLILLVNLQTSGQPGNPDFDPGLAKELGADNYGMKSYIFVILKSGTASVNDKQVRDSLLSGHLKNIQRLADERKLVLAGPLGDNGRSFRGIFIFDVPDTNIVKDLLKTDPAINAKIFDTELYEWYGSAALGEYLKVHKKITRDLF